LCWLFIRYSIKDYVTPSSDRSTRHSRTRPHRWCRCIRSIENASSNLATFLSIYLLTTTHSTLHYRHCPFSLSLTVDFSRTLIFLLHSNLRFSISPKIFLSRHPITHAPLTSHFIDSLFLPFQHTSLVVEHSSFSCSSSF